MRLIDRYICRQVFSHALLGLGIFTFVFFVPQLVRLMDLVVRHPASWSTIGVLFLSTFPGFSASLCPSAFWLVYSLLWGGCRPTANSSP